jgi:O-antigen/teichoic acid export membrane protein
MAFRIRYAQCRMSRVPGAQTSAASRHRQPGLHRAARDSRRKNQPDARQATLSANRVRATTHPDLGQVRTLAKALRRPGFARTIVDTAGFNIIATCAAGLGGIIIARAVGPTVRGQYAAVTAWFGAVVMLGGLGQPAALCFYVARDPSRAREYVATSRAMMLTTGVLAFAFGMVIAPLIAHGNTQVTLGYRIAFATVMIALVGYSCIYPLQARDISQWNVARIIQPSVSLIAILVLWRLRLLTLDSALVVLAATILAQSLWGYRSSRRAGLMLGHARANLVRPLAYYGVAQTAALIPAFVNQQLDQLVLSQTVPPADLGRYAIAVSFTMLPLSAVSAIGYVALPRLAAKRHMTAADRRLQRIAILGSIGLSIALLVPLVVVAPWLVPLVFGSAYRGSVPLIWVLTPGSVFWSSGQVVGDLLQGRGHPAVGARAQCLAMPFTIGLMFALLPSLGVYAAAIASTVSYGVALVVMLHRLLHLPSHARGNGSMTPT